MEKIKSSIIALSVSASVFAASAHTYTITDLGSLDTNTSFATGINASSQVSDYSASASNAARAWRYSPGVGLADLGSFGGTDNHALGINYAGHVSSTPAQP